MEALAYVLAGILAVEFGGLLVLAGIMWSESRQRRRAQDAVRQEAGRNVRYFPSRRVG